ncbi:MAG TPA: hypothetical protein VJQ83_09195 [Tepidiformaceae bacterium]|nr:hypothetical protein [Tepidiformaceae bacterium]
MSVLDKVMNMFKSAKDQGQGLAAKGQDMAGSAADRAQGMASQAKDMAGNAMDEVKEHIPGGGDDAPTSQS